MIKNDRQLSNTRRKLTRLQKRAAVVAQRLRSSAESDALRVTLRSYRSLIRQLQEEITRYELGIDPPSRKRLENDEQRRATISKLESLQRLEATQKNEPNSPARNLSLLSLRRTMNQLREEIAWYEAHHVSRTINGHTVRELIARNREDRG